MTPPGVSRRDEGLSEEAVLAATGRTWEEWFALLDEAGATEWTHPVIARWLQDEHLVAAWWAQGITVGFEQARGIRLPGQRADGTFEVSTSKTLPLDQHAALDAVVTAVTAAVGAPPVSESRGARYMTARWDLQERESILATAAPTSSGKTSVALTHRRMTDAAQMVPAKAAMQAWLGAASKAPGGLG